jgi:hypothetical protein
VRDSDAIRAFPMRFVSLVSVVSLCQLVHKKGRCSGDASYSRNGLLNMRSLAHRGGRATFSLSKAPRDWDPGD